VMPQTIEAISHAKNAGVPMIVAINKIDLPQANAMKVKQDLLQHGVVLEEFGGTTLSTEISAKKGTGIPELLEQVLLQAELLDLKSNPDKRATGTVVEAQLDAGKGPVATVLVQSGTLRVGDDFIVGMYSGRVRALLDERGKAVKSAGPAIPVQVLGMQGVPMAGDQLLVVEDAGAAREVAQRRERLDREAKSRRTTRGGVTLEDFMTQSTAGEVRSLRILIKADRPKRSPTRSSSSARARSRSRWCTAASAPSRRATSSSRARRARSSSASTCVRTTTRARRPSVRTSTSSSIASSTKPSRTCARRSRACCARNSAK
jgi:translation initiation factor IF-2